MKNHSIIGREREQQILKNICDEREARLVAIYGRRRVGKTYLVKNFFKEDFDFFFTGSFETPAKIQLTLFQNALNQQTGTDVRTPKSWFEAFDRLKSYLISLKKEKIVVFLDEFWLVCDGPQIFCPILVEEGGEQDIEVFLRCIHFAIHKGATCQHLQISEVVSKFHAVLDAPA